MTFTLKKRIYLTAGINTVVAVALLIMRLLGIHSDFFNAMTIGLFTVTVPFLIFLLIKVKDKEYQEDYDLSRQDERIKRNYEKAYRMGYLIQTILILTVSVICYALEVNMYFPVIGAVMATSLFTKIYGWKLNKSNN